MLAMNEKHVNVEGENEHLCNDLYNCFEAYITKILDASYTKQATAQPKQTSPLYLYPIKPNMKTTRKSPIMISLDREIRDIITTAISNITKQAQPIGKPIIVTPVEKDDTTQKKLEEANLQMQKMQNKIAKLRMDYFKELNAYHLRQNSEDKDPIEVQFFDASEGFDEDTIEIMNSRIRIIKNNYNQLTKKLMGKIKESEESLKKYSLLTPNEYSVINMPLEEIFKAISKLYKEKDVVWKAMVGAYGQEWIDAIIEENYGDIKHCEEYLECEFSKIKEKVQTTLNTIVDETHKELETVQSENEKLVDQLAKDKLSRVTDIELARYELECEHKEKISKLNKEWEQKIAEAPQSKDIMSARVALQLWKFKSRKEGNKAYNAMDQLRSKKQLYKYERSQAINKCDRYEREITNIANQFELVKNEQINAVGKVKKLASQLNSITCEYNSQCAELSKYKQIIKDKLSQFTIVSPIKGLSTMIISEHILQEIHQFNRLKRVEAFRHQACCTEMCDAKKEIMFKPTIKIAKVPYFHEEVQTISVKTTTDSSQTIKDGYKSHPVISTLSGNSLQKCIKTSSLFNFFVESAQIVSSNAGSNECSSRKQSSSGIRKQRPNEQVKDKERKAIMLNEELMPVFSYSPANISNQCNQPHIL